MASATKKKGESKSTNRISTAVTQTCGLLSCGNPAADQQVAPEPGVEPKNQTRGGQWEEKTHFQTLKGQNAVRFADVSLRMAVPDSWSTFSILLPRQPEIHQRKLNN